LRAAFPLVVLVWVDILQRRQWLGAVNPKAIEEKRKRLNRLGRHIFKTTGVSDTIICDMNASEGFFGQDGVHLNDLGKEFYNDYLRDSIIKHD